MYKSFSNKFILADIYFQHAALAHPAVKAELHAVTGMFGKRKDELLCFRRYFIILSSPLIT